VFGPGVEYAMLRYAYPFRLEDARGALLEAFRGLTSPCPRAAWSPDSRIVAVAVDGGLLLFDVRARRYAAVRFAAYQQTVRLTREAVRVAVHAGQFRAVFGGRFRPPRASVLPFVGLRWRGAPRTWQPASMLHGAPAPRWEPPPSPALRAYARARRIKLRA
jgi:hypothetical protein